MNGENAADGFGMTPEIAERFFKSGVHVVTSGNHIWQRREILPMLQTNDRLLRFGGELSDFLYQIFLYLTFNSEEKPFPFADWPGREDSGDSEADVADGVITAPHADDTHDSDK